jgi:hypothetical protein
VTRPFWLVNVLITANNLAKSMVYRRNGISSWSNWSHFKLKSTTPIDVSKSQFAKKVGAMLEAMIWLVN